MLSWIKPPRRPSASGAGQRCEYCHFPEAFAEIPFHLDHVIAGQHGGATRLENLAPLSQNRLLCSPSPCNGAEGATLDCKHTFSSSRALIAARISRSELRRQQPRPLPHRSRRLNRSMHRRSSLSSQHRHRSPLMPQRLSPLRNQSLRHLSLNGHRRPPPFNRRPLRSLRLRSCSRSTRRHLNPLNSNCLPKSRQKPKRSPPDWVPIG